MDTTDPDYAKMKSIVEEFADEDCEHVNVTKLKQCKLGVIAITDLNMAEKEHFQFYSRAFDDGSDAAQMAAFQRILQRIEDKPESEWTDDDKALVEKFNAVSDLFIGAIVSNGIGNTEIVVDGEESE